MVSWLLVHKEGGDGPKTDAISKAFVTALNLVGLDTSAGIEITIDGELPLGVGLGSSAAFSVCLLRVLLSCIMGAYRQATN